MVRPAFLDDPALRRILAALPDARPVGGCVRDALAGRLIADIDIATPTPPDEVMAILARHGLRTIATGLTHGTVTAVVDGRGFEITTLRRDLRTDGRRAEIAFTQDWREDAARRDFTMNAMSMTIDGTVHDYFCGVADLTIGRLRFVGDPATRLAEDRLRTLRYFRFYARYARLSPCPTTRTALAAAAPDLHRLSAERVWSELKRILSSPLPPIRLMDELDVLAAILPEGVAIARLERLVDAGGPADPLLRLAALSAGDVAAFSSRMRLSGEETARLVSLRSPEIPGCGITDGDLRRMLADTPKQILIDRLWLAGKGASLRERLASMAPPVFPLAGRDALLAGFAPGPAVGEALRSVRAWWLAGGCVANAASCFNELRKLNTNGYKE